MFKQPQKKHKASNLHCLLTPLAHARLTQARPALPRTDLPKPARARPALPYQVRPKVRLTMAHK